MTSQTSNHIYGPIIAAILLVAALIPNLAIPPARLPFSISSTISSTATRTPSEMSGIHPNGEILNAYLPGDVGIRPTSGQAVFAAHLQDDQQSLDGGILLYKTIKSLNINEDAWFVVTITDVGIRRKDLTLNQPRAFGQFIDSQNIPTGGIISVVATCRNLVCEPESAERQAVLTAREKGRWTWDLLTESPGPGYMTLDVRTWLKNSKTISLETETIRITIPVQATNPYRVKEILTSAGSVISWIGGPVVVLTGIGMAWRLRRRGRGSHTLRSPTRP